MLKRLLPPFGFLKRSPVLTSFTNPTKASEIPAYPDAFAACERFSRMVYQDLEPMVIRPITAEPQRLIRAIEKVVIENRLTEQDFRAAAGQCMKWVRFLAPHVAVATGLNCWPTIGQLWNGDVKVWGPSWEKLRSLIEGGIHAEHLMEGDCPGLNLHAWLTLETGEIVDPTFWTSLAVFRGGPFSNQLGAIAFGPETTVLSGHRFFPMLAGTRILDLLQSRSSLRLLAIDREDLGRGPAMVLAL